MNNPLFRTFLLLLLSFIFLAACSNPTPTESPLPAARGISVTLKTQPDIPVVGDIELLLDIADENGQPLDGAVVEVSADHTDMSGMVMSGTATGQGNGRYAITADFSMSGNWLVTVSIKKDAIEEKHEIRLKIE